MYICVCRYVHVHVFVCSFCVCISVCVYCISMHIHVHMYLHVYMLMYMCAHVYVYACACLCIYGHIYVVGVVLKGKPSGQGSGAPLRVCPGSVISHPTGCVRPGSGGDGVCSLRDLLGTMPEAFPGRWGAALPLCPSVEGCSSSREGRESKSPLSPQRKPGCSQGRILGWDRLIIGSLPEPQRERRDSG